MTVKRVTPVSFQALQASGRLPSGPQIEEHEMIVRRELPVLESVEAAETEADRMLAYEKLIAKQHAEFVRQHGDAYGGGASEPKLAPVLTSKIAMPLAAIMYGAA